MLQTVKLFTRRCNNFEKLTQKPAGLSFGEFCVLASDFRKFRTHANGVLKNDEDFQAEAATNKTTVIISESDVTTPTNGPEVFLGGSCNPTTWRADVAIPALDQLGISFYNPVSH